MQRSRLPLMLALVTFGLSLLSGAYVYNRLVRTVPVLEAVKDLPAGGALSEELVRVTQVPASAVPADALKLPDEIANKYATIPLLAGQMLTARHVSGQPATQDPMEKLAPGQVIISVPIKAEAVLGGAMRPGDLVDVAAAWPGQESKPGTVEILATRVQVVDLRNASGLSTTGAGESAGADGAVPSSVLLLVNSQQARTVVGAVEAKAVIYLWFTGRARS